tara:strand:- start:194 stop:565 length:372 start_codon:yes stop_codon:yes gene_type:complete
MLFKLNKVDHKMSRKYLPVSSIIEYVRCDKCNTRDTSNLDVGFSLIGVQVWCINCDKSILHIELKGHNILADTCPKGKFNSRNGRGTTDKVSSYTVSSIDLLKQDLEEQTNSGIDKKLRHIPA